MREMKSIAMLFAFPVLTLGAPIDLIAQDDSPPVTEFKRLYASDSEFKRVVDLMFDNVHPLAGGSENPVKGKTVDDLYPFLNEWFFFLPNTHDGLDRIAKFSFLFYKNPYGEKFILEEPGKSWSLFS